MSRKEFEPAPHLATLSVRLPIRLLGRLYTAAAQDRPHVSTIVHEALERWLEERDRIKVRAREEFRNRTPKR